LGVVKQAPQSTKTFGKEAPQVFELTPVALTALLTLITSAVWLIALARKQPY
jgi:hypothetical protein